MSTRKKDSRRKKKFGLALRLLLGVAAVCDANVDPVASAEAPELGR
jgi:hypothetical protein